MARAHSFGGALAVEHAERCASLLGVSLPVSPEGLKAAYRAKAKLHHPDAGGDAETFRRVKDAYDFIANGGALGITTNGKAPRPAQTMQGDLLVDLGKGLGPRINGKTCVCCRGLGYTTERDWRTGAPDFHWTCGHCSGTGEVEMFNPVLPKWRLARTKQGSKPPKKRRIEPRKWSPTSEAAKAFMEESAHG